MNSNPKHRLLGRLLLLLLLTQAQEFLLNLRGILGLLHAFRIVGRLIDWLRRLGRRLRLFLFDFVVFFLAVIAHRAGRGDGLAAER